MKNLKRALVAILVVTSLISCTNDGVTIVEKDSIIGKWQMYGTTQYAIEFTNFGIVKWTNKPHMPQELVYTINKATLTVSDKNGKVIFLGDDNTLTISGFSDPSTSGYAGTKGPYINGTYIRQK